MQSDTHAFIVRVWHEEVDDHGNVTVWRGYIDHVGSGKRLYFFDLEGIAAFIQEQASLNRTPSGPVWKSILAWIKDEKT